MINAGYLSAVSIPFTAEVVVELKKYSGGIGHLGVNVNCSDGLRRNALRT